MEIQEDPLSDLDCTPQMGEETGLPGTTAGLYRHRYVAT